METEPSFNVLSKGLEQQRIDPRSARKEAYPLYHYHFLILLSHCGEYGGEWAYECNSPPILNDHKNIARHS